MLIQQLHSLALTSTHFIVMFRLSLLVCLIVGAILVAAQVDTGHVGNGMNVLSTFLDSFL